jgi:hypothetical protein
MATVRAIAGSHKTQVLGLHPYEMHVAIGIEELELRMANDVETCYAIDPTHCAQDRALIGPWQTTKQCGRGLKETNASPAPNQLTIGISRRRSL